MIKIKNIITKKNYPTILIVVGVLWVSVLFLIDFGIIVGIVHILITAGVSIIIGTLVYFIYTKLPEGE